MIISGRDIDNQSTNMTQALAPAKQLSLQLYSEFQLRERPEDQLIMTNFKTHKCENQQHLQQVQIYAFSCQAYHGNFDRRRPLFDFSGQLKYSEILCPNILQHQLLIKMCPEDCQFSHNQFEENYHPAKFRVFPCDNANHLSDSSIELSKSEDFCQQEGNLIVRQTCHKYHEHTQIRFNAQKYFNQIQTSPLGSQQNTIPSNIQPCSVGSSSLPRELGNDKIINQQNFTVEPQNYNELACATNNQIKQFPGMATNESSGKNSETNAAVTSFNGSDVNRQYSQSQQDTQIQSQNISQQQISLAAQSQQNGVNQNSLNVSQNYQQLTSTQVSQNLMMNSNMQQYGTSTNQIQGVAPNSSTHQMFFNSAQNSNQGIVPFHSQNNAAAISSQLQQLTLSNQQQQYFPNQHSIAHFQGQASFTTQSNFSNQYPNLANQHQHHYSNQNIQQQQQNVSDQTNSGTQNMYAIDTSTLSSQNKLQESSQPFIPLHKKQKSLHDSISGQQSTNPSFQSGQNVQQNTGLAQNYSQSQWQQSAGGQILNNQAAVHQHQSQNQSQSFQQNSFNQYNPYQNLSQYQGSYQTQSSHANHYQSYHQQNQPQQRYSNQYSGQNQGSGGFEYNQKQSYSSQNNAFIKAQQNQVFEIYFQSQIESIRHLILKDFKTEQCPISYQHNHKHCKFFHSIKDKRRVRDSVSPDLCDFAETEKCPKQDGCNLAHNKVERLYHTEKYKTKFCTKFPKQLANCDYGEYCSFAHSQTDLKTRIIHTMQKDADYYQFYFKTEWCPFNKEHNKAQCDYAHNWQDFRRKPHIFNYNAHELCQNWQAGTFIGKYEEGCILQAACLRSHGWKEQEYHPLYYKTRPCPEVKCGQINQCPFYHTEQDKRVVNGDNHQQIMFPKLRTQNEQLATITLRNMVLNNVNHLKEFLINNGLHSMAFQQLQAHFSQTNPPTPTVLLQYLDVKGVVVSDRMRQLIVQNEHHIFQMNMLQSNQNSSNQITQMQIQQYSLPHISQMQMQYQQPPAYFQPPPGFENVQNQVIFSSQNAQQPQALYMSPAQIQHNLGQVHDMTINQGISISQKEQLPSFTSHDSVADQLSFPLKNVEQPLIPGFRSARTEIIQDFSDEQIEEQKANQQNGSTDAEEEKDFTNNQPLYRQMTTQQTIQQPIITVEQFTSSNPPVQNKNRDRKNQFRKFGKGNSTENNTLSSGNHLASNLETGLALKSGRASPVGSKFLSNQQLTLTDEIQQYQPSNLVVPSFLNPNAVTSSPKTSPKSKPDNQHNTQKGFKKMSNKANDLKSEDSIFGANQQDEEEGRSSEDKGISEDDYDNEDEQAMSDSLFQKVMRKINDATSSQGGMSGGGSTTKAVTIPIQEISQTETESQKLRAVQAQNTERFNTNGYEVDSLSSGSLNTGNNASYNRQGTAQPVSYQNKLQQFEQEFLRVNSMNKSVRSIFSSSSKSKSKTNSAKVTKKKKLGDGSANPGSGSNQGIEGVSGGAIGVNDEGSELEKLSDASALSSNQGSTRSRKLFNKDLSPHAIDEEDHTEANMD